MDLIDRLRVLRRWWWLVMLMVLVGAGTAVALTLEATPIYATRTVALVNPKQILINNSDIGAYLTTDQLVQTYVQLVNTTPVHQGLLADGVPRTVGQLSGEITAKVEVNTSLVDINIQDPNPAVAFQIAQDIVPAFNNSLDELQARFARPGSSTPRLEALVPWQVPTNPPVTAVSPSPSTNLALGILAGAVVGSLLAFLFERIDDTVKSDYDIRLQLNLPVVGVVRRLPGRATAVKSSQIALVTHTRPKDPASEAYRAVRTSLMYRESDNPLRTLVVTSALPGEGKTSTASNLAVVMAQAGNRVILVDADFRRPELHRLFHRRENIGLGNLILGNMAEEEALFTTAVPNLRVLCSGPTPPNPSELLGSTRMAEVMEALEEEADLVIFDSPPVGVVTDAAILAAQADGVLLVVERRRAQIRVLQGVKDRLAGVGAEIVGVVLNKVQNIDSAEYYYYYRYYGEKAGTNGKQTPLVPTTLTRRTPAATAARERERVAALTSRAVAERRDAPVAVHHVVHEPADLATAVEDVPVAAVPPDVPRSPGANGAEPHTAVDEPPGEGTSAAGEVTAPAEAEPVVIERTEVESTVAKPVDVDPIEVEPVGTEVVDVPPAKRSRSKPAVDTAETLENGPNVESADGSPIPGDDVDARPAEPDEGN